MKQIRQLKKLGKVLMGMGSCSGLLGVASPHLPFKLDSESLYMIGAMLALMGLISSTSVWYKKFFVRW